MSAKDKTQRFQKSGSKWLSEPVTYTAIRILTNEEIDRDKLFIETLPGSPWIIARAKDQGIERIMIQRYKAQADYFDEITWHDVTEVSQYSVVNILRASQLRPLGPHYFNFSKFPYTIYDTEEEAFQAFWLGINIDRFIII